MVLKADFYQITQGDCENLYNLAVSECIRFYRSDRFKGKISILTCSAEEAKRISMLLWRADGFFPNTMSGAPDQILSPIVIGPQAADKCSLLINLQLNKKAFTENELNSEMIIDFLADFHTESIEACRWRYKQLKKSASDFEFHRT